MSLFSSNQTEVMILALLDAVNDKNDDVRNAVTSSIHALGKKKPNIVLDACFSYLQKHSKLSVAHRVLVLMAIHKICLDVVDNLPQNLAVQLIKQAAEEMTSSKDVVPDWQSAASGILVALGTKFCHDVMETLMSYFQPGILPHFFILQTFGNLASGNVYGIVPFLKAVLGTLLPMVGMMRLDNMKWVTAFALAKFSEAITEYIANIDKAPDPTVKIEVFAVEISMAYDIILTWINTKEAKLRIAVIEAIGQMSHLLPQEKLEEQLPRLIPIILGLYKRQTELHHLTQSLYMVIENALKKHCNGLDGQIDQIIQCLFPQVCSLPDYLKPLTVKNHNEVLRCFSLLAQAYPNTMMQMLQTNLDNNTERVRIGTLTILRHIINTPDTQIRERTLSLLSSLNSVLYENNNKVKKVLAHLIVALAHHGYLDEEIGVLFLEFLVRQCALHVDTAKAVHDADPENSDEALRKSCENILHLLSTTVPHIEKVLWPYLLFYLLPEKYTEAVAVVSKNAALVANKLREENSPDYEIDYTKHRDIPRPSELFSRLIVLIGHPSKNRIQRINVLQLMKSLSPVINKNLVALWDLEIPYLLKFLTDVENSLDEKLWEMEVLNFFSSTLDEVDQEKWTKMLSKVLMKHMKLYSDATVKGFCMKCVGVTLKKILDDNLVDHYLEDIFTSVQYAEEAEREGCATAFGRTSFTHLDLVLTKLDKLRKSDVGRKSSGIFSFFMDSKVDINQELCKATVILGYGSVCRFAPISLLIPRVEVYIVKNILLYFQQAKQLEVKLCLLHSVDELAQALHPSRLNEPVNHLSRKDLLDNVQNFLKEESMMAPSQIKISILNCLTSLIKLDPPLLGPEKEICLRNCLESVYTLPDEDDRSTKKLMDSSLNSLNGLLQAMLLSDLVPDNLFLIISNLESWLQAPRAHERNRGIESIYKLLKLFLEKVSLGIGKPLTFGPLGAIVGRLIPRCTDSVVFVRQTALESICITFQIAAVYDGHTRDYSDSVLLQLSKIKNDIVTDKPNELYALTKDIGQLLATKLPVHQVAPFLHVLYEGLLDNMPSSSCGVCVVFNAVVKNRGGELHQQVDVLMKLLNHRMGLITCSATKKALLQVLRTLASHHLMAVTNFLLNSNPQDSSVVESWRALAQDPSLGCNILEHLLELFDRVPAVSEHADPRNNKKTVNLANPQILAAVLAMKEIFHQAEMEESCKKLFARIFASLLLLCGSLVDSHASISNAADSPKGKGVWPPLIVLEKKMDTTSPVRSVIEALQSFLLCSKQENVLQEVTDANCWLMMESVENYPDSISLLARSLSIHAPFILANIVSHLNSSSTSGLANHRIVIASFFAELINQRCCGDNALLELLLNNLVNSLIDNCHTVRKLSVRGLGCVGKVGADQVHKYSTTVLSAMLAGLDDRDDPNGDITLEAMSGLSKVLAEIDPSLVSPVLISIVLRIRPCFENARSDVRATSFVLFGDLARFGKGEEHSPFVEQIHNNFVTLLLHLNDEDEMVIKACKHALRLVGPLLRSEAVNNMFQKHLRDESVLYYLEFMNDLIKILVIDLAEKVPLYISTNSVHFKSNWPVIQGNAATFIGFMMSSLSPEHQIDLAKEPICTALMLLLKSPEKEVRIRAAASMSLLNVS